MSTDEQGALFDLAEGERRKTAGMAAAADAERVQKWKTKAEAVLEALADSRMVFTADDVIAGAGLPSKGTNRNNVVGAVFSAAAKRGLIVKTGSWAQSKRPEAHGRWVPVWVGAPS